MEIKYKHKTNTKLTVPATVRESLRPETKDQIMSRSMQGSNAGERARVLTRAQVARADLTQVTGMILIEVDTMMKK